MTYEEWVQYVRSPGGTALMPFAALTKPCPRCGQHKGYAVTNDSHAYCRACGFGTPTDYNFTDYPYVVLDAEGKEVPDLESGPGLAL